MRPDEYQRFFDLEDNHFWFQGMRRIVFHWLQRRVGASARVLDVGCGTGGTLTLMPPGWTRIGIDYAPEALSFALTRGEKSLARASAEALPFPDAAFDAVVALDVLEHCDHDHAAAGELQRVLKPGGTLILTVPAFPFLWSQHDDVVQHRRRYRRAGLDAVLKKAGFSVLKLSYYNTLLFPPIAAAKLLKRIVPVGRPESDNVPIPGPINAALAQVFGFERRLLDHMDLPFGVSLLAVGTPDSRAATAGTTPS